jgi:hypothetical protein
MPGEGPAESLHEEVDPHRRVTGQIREIARRRALGADPASGLHRPAEERAALILERRAGLLTRDPSGAADWLDAAGRSYDAVGPVPAGRFDLGAFTRQIDQHLRKQGLDRVVVDITGLSATDRGSVLSHISRLPAPERARIIIQP